MDETPEGTTNQLDTGCTPATPTPAAPQPPVDSSGCCCAAGRWSGQRRFSVLTDGVCHVLERPGHCPHLRPYPGRPVRPAQTIPAGTGPRTPVPPTPPALSSTLGDTSPGGFA